MVRLTEEQKQFYKDNGYILLKNLISEEELSRVIDKYDKLFKRKNQDTMENSWVGDNKNNRKTDNPRTVKGVHNLQHHHAVFGKLLYNDNILDALEDVMETENIMLHHTKAHFKPPEKGAAYPMHQDYPYFPYEKDSMVAVFIHLDAANPENGGLFVYPGSHKLGPLEDIGAKESNFHYVDQKRFPLEKATPVIADRGDIVIFSYLLVHGSSVNNSDRPRRMFLAQFHAADDKPIGDQRQQPGYGWMLRGANFEKDAAISKQYE
ncbi:putative alpha-ketoglutarate-dependent hypophosphite dioxygenase [Anticarsia gemmatalis]|uniref:putative alpha-ketoglutarate-dependent hypophosphite dioxygenase n=1 Tax=Anticarsia gemmatalis TaxID=129554 RepID=UPI003F76212B